MPAGIEVYNADGTLQFDITNRLFRTLSFQTGTGSAGSVTIPGASTQGTIRVAATLTDAGDDAAPPPVTISGNTVSWGAGAASKFNIMVY